MREIASPRFSGGDRSAAWLGISGLRNPLGQIEEISTPWGTISLDLDSHKQGQAISPLVMYGGAALLLLLILRK